jgi:hypothetical protein
MQAIELDTSMAKAGSGGSSRIDSKGKYKGVIQYIKTWTTDNGAKMMQINFKADSDQEARMNVCLFGKTGDPTYGYKQFQALMACCKLRKISEAQATVKDYNPETSQTEDMQRTVFPEFTNMKAGLVLYRHDQNKYSDQTKTIFTMEIAAPFNYETEQTAQEVLDSAPAKQLEKIVLNLKDKDTRTASNEYSGYSGMPEANDLDSDSIPF